ncbi:MAG: diaminopimelate epimerase [Myxococcales bacterium]|nr:diaminopimelate epimerase [Myxococcales bacterium]
MPRTPTETAFKYHGLGNDFVLLDRRQGGGDIGAERTRELCDRRRGIGADGVLVLLPSERAAARMVVHNADGTVAEMCGNGIRCAAKHLADRSDGRPPELSIETGAGVLTCRLVYVGGEVSQVEVSMGPARLLAPNLPSSATGRPFLEQPLPVAGLKGTALSLGNPHLVVCDCPLERASEVGPLLERTPGFAERTNVELCRASADGLEVAVWERGVGLTLACGTGACAAVAAAVHQGKLPPSAWIPVRLSGGMAEVRVAKDLSEVELRGPATFVFEAIVPAPR